MEDWQVPAAGAPGARSRVGQPRHVQRYLHRLDRAGTARRELVRMPTTWSSCAGIAARPKKAWSATSLLAALGLEPKAVKTRIVHLEAEGEGFDFLGFHHRLVRSRGRTGTKPVTFLARWPAVQGQEAARDRIGTDPPVASGLALELVVEDLNRSLGGWAAYFRFGQLRSPLREDQELRADAAGAVHQQAHRRSREFGWSVATSPRTSSD